MKKYIITENQLKVILERAEDTPKNYEKVPKMTFDQFLKTINVGGSVSGANSDDKKAFVSASVSANSASRELNKADSALKAIAGKFYDNAFGINSNDAALSDSDNLCIIIMSLTDYYRREGKMQSVVRDVNLDWGKNYRVIKNAMSSSNEGTVIRDLVSLLKANFDSDIAATPPDDKNEVIVFPKGPNPSFQTRVNTSNPNNPETVSVRFNYMNGADLSFFIDDFLKNSQNMKIIRKTLGNSSLKYSVKGGSLIFQF